MVVGDCRVPNDEPSVSAAKPRFQRGSALERSDDETERMFVARRTQRSKVGKRREEVRKI